MDIQDLKDKQADLTRQSQISFQTLVKRKLKQHGLDNRQALHDDLQQNVDKLSKRVGAKALSLGMEWLQG